MNQVPKPILSLFWKPTSPVSHAISNNITASSNTQTFSPKEISREQFIPKLLFQDYQTPKWNDCNVV